MYLDVENSMTQRSVDSLIKKLWNEGFSVASKLPRSPACVFYVYDPTVPVYFSDIAGSDSAKLYPEIEFPTGMDQPPFDEMPVGYVISSKGEQDRMKLSFVYYHGVVAIKRWDRIKEVCKYLER